jgi:hypothetical protein
VCSSLDGRERRLTTGTHHGTTSHHPMSYLMTTTKKTVIPRQMSLLQTSHFLTS